MTICDNLLNVTMCYDDRYTRSKYLSVAMITVGITIATLASASSVVCLCFIPHSFIIVNSVDLLGSFPIATCSSYLLPFGR